MTAEGSSVLRARRVVVGVTGSVAIYKACELVGRMRKAGAEVQVVMTASAAKLVGPDLFRSLSGREVAAEMFGSRLGGHPHVDLARWADLVVVAPATANLLGKMAAGVADDLLSTLVLAARCPVLLAPAMNIAMWENPVVQRNLEKLRGLGRRVVEGESGWLACGEEGKGRMAEVDAIVEAVEAVLAERAGGLAGRRVLITAGRTEEAIDEVRYVSNRSSGKTGAALAAEARRRGAEVTYVSGPTSVPDPEDVKVVRVRSAAEMKEAVLGAFAEADVLVMAAAVADYRPAEVRRGKTKKTGEAMDLALVPTEDILLLVKERRRPEQVVVGFALETENEVARARAKLAEKGLDLIVVNNPVAADAGFGQDRVAAAILDSGASAQGLSTMTKQDLAARLFDRVVERLGERG